ncbi:hypothetical protein PG996_007872 [Apiospora saccharicola]|uniref:Uncharacterized protein n=1 Tax=Apiospora saccharicola TaxID=335842 RepID=A0ABR1UWE0_9PEZI
MLAENRAHTLGIRLGKRRRATGPEEATKKLVENWATFEKDVGRPEPRKFHSRIKNTIDTIDWRPDLLKKAHKKQICFACIMRSQDWDQKFLHGRERGYMFIAEEVEWMRLQFALYHKEVWQSHKSHHGSPWEFVMHFVDGRVWDTERWQLWCQKKHYKCMLLGVNF